MCVKACFKNLVLYRVKVCVEHSVWELVLRHSVWSSMATSSYGIIIPSAWSNPMRNRTVLRNECKFVLDILKYSNLSNKLPS